MKIFMIAFFLLFCSLNADFFDNSVINKVEKIYKKFAKNRFIAANDLLEKAKDENTKTKLEVVNDFFNNISYRSDQKIYGVSDYWATPIESLARDEADCEDYAIAKYFALEYLGIPTSKMFLSYVRLKKSNEAHMVLSYFETPNAEPVVLDNIIKKIFPASKRGDLTPIFNFNPNILKDNKTTAHRKWDVLIKNYKEQKL